VNNPVQNRICNMALAGTEDLVSLRRQPSVNPASAQEATTVQRKRTVSPSWLETHKWV